MENTLLENPSKFMFAGKAVFTILNNLTGNRFTYKIKRTKDGKRYSLLVLTGSDNEHSYTYAGTIFDYTSYGHSATSTIGRDAQSIKVFDCVFKHLILNTLPSCVEIHHKGCCGRCGRALTVPESIKSGIGSECAKKIG